MTQARPSIFTRHHGVFIWSVAIGIIATGGYLSHIAYLGYEWVSRAGCLIVVLGIWSSLGGMIQERFLLGRLRWRRRNAIVRARAALQAKDTPTDDIERQIDEIEDLFDKESVKLSEKLRVSLGMLEVSLLITGTLLWGFGDILAAWLFAN